MNRITTILFFVFTSFYSFANQWEEAVEKGQYESLVQEGYRSADLFFNNGLSYLETDNIAQAVLNFERALIFSPNDPQIKEAIDASRDKIFDAVLIAEPFFLSEWIKTISGAFSGGGWAFVSFILLMLCASAVYGFLVDKKWKPWLSHALFISLTISLLIISLLLSYVRYSQYFEDSYGIMMVSEAKLRQAPDELSKSLFTIGAGEKVEILKEIGEWYQIELLNRDNGWVLSKDVEPIQLPN